MPVSTLAQFKTATRLAAKGLRMGKLRDVRGNNIKPIDDCLQAYDQVRASYNNGAKSQTLSALLSECARWLKTKKDKANGSVNARRAVILQLANDAFVDLRALQRAGGKDFYNLNKAITTGNQANYQKKSLSGAYAHERNVYVSQGKAQFPPSGSNLHSAHDQLPHVGLPKGFNTPQGQELMTRDWGHLTQADFELLAEMQGNTGSVVHFANKDVRSANLMVVYQGYNVDFEDIQTAAFDTQGDPNGFMYAMDEYGTLFASPATGLAKGTDYWNHSSFNAGKDVICAGMIKIHAGVLQYVDNNSGHYKPTRQHLHAMMTIIANEGVNLAAATVVVRQPAAAKNFIDEHTLGAALFVGNVNLVDPNKQTVPA
ncbi:MAG: hypothetical protein ABIT38_02980 [Gemmatimonadaceae bacterium]